MSLRVQLERAGIELMVHEEKLVHSEEHEKLYWIRVDLSRNRGVRLSDVALERGERGLTIAEGIALAIEYPEVIAERST